MSNSPDRCSQLRALQANLTEQVRVLREGVQKAEREGVVTSVENLNIIKRLQASLHSIQLELEKCPPEKDAPISAAQQAPVKVSPTRWGAEGGNDEIVSDDDEF